MDQMSRLLLLPVRIVELVLAALIAGTLLVLLAPRLLLPRRLDDGPRRLLVLDTAYTLRTIQARGLERSITARDLDGYFEHVWSVHPLVGASEEEGADGRFGAPREEAIAPRHTFLEGHVGRFRSLRMLPVLNFALAQASLVLHLNRLIRRERIAVIRAGEPFYQGPMGLLLARSNGSRLAIRINGNYDAIYAATGRRAFPRLYPSRRLENAVGRFVLKRASLVVAPNEDNLRYALRAGAREGHTAVFPYGNLVHPAHFEPPESRPRPARLSPRLPACKGLLVFVGRLDPVKHAADLVDVLARVRASEADTGLVLIGDGPLRAPMEARARDLGVHDATAFLGNLDQQSIASILPMTSVIVSPHMGRALVEAALSGRPIVAYDNDWQSELCITGRTGELVPMGDREAMAVAVVDVLRDPARAARLGQGARELALLKMDPSRLNALERQTFERLLLGQPQPPPAIDRAVSGA